MKRIAIFGGTSDIGVAIVEEMLRRDEIEVVLAVRPGSPYVAKVKARLLESGAREVDVVDFDATDVASHPDIVKTIFARDVNVAVVAFGVLGDNERAWQDHKFALEQVETNTTGAISIGVLLGRAFAARGHGRIVAISSMAAEKVRRSNFVYGATKAAMDAFYTHLGEALRPEGVTVLVVRPGFVRSKMTHGRPPVALSTTPERVATATVDALERGKSLIRVPRIFGAVILVYKHLPAVVVRHLRF